MLKHNLPSLTTGNYCARTGRASSGLQAGSFEELLLGNAMEPCLSFFEAVAMAEPRTIRVGLSPTCLLELELDFQRHCQGSLP